MKSIPNILSSIRIVLAPLFFLLYMQDDILWAALSVAVFAAAAVTDYFDGYIARRFGAESQMGVFLDPLGDKFLTIAGFLCLPFLDASQFPWWIIIVIIFRDVFVTGLRLYTDKKGWMMRTSISAKIKTFVQMAFLYVALLAGVFQKADHVIAELSFEFFETQILGFILWIVMILTVYTAVQYVYQNKDQLFGKK